MSTTITPKTELDAGTWAIDPSHSAAGFTVRHAMISKVRGRFEGVSGTVIVAEDLAASEVRAEIDLASIRTGDEARDTHLRSAEFFDVERFPAMVFTSRSIRADGDGWLLVGDLELHGVTKTVELALEFNGVARDPFGNTRAGFSATTQLNRKDFGLTWNAALETGGVLVGDKVTVDIDVALVRQDS